ncbi:hypothetical protein HED60_19290 [Planctomycetales bacterium ZRK34]|nr:hypothetical protein HED60_19290 [Planctomycetales bacterium ZRK34]
MIAVATCQKYRERVEGCRSSWLSLWGHCCDYLFFQGGETESLSGDILTLTVADTYAALPQKTYALLRYVADNDLCDYLFKCDDDSFVHIPRLLDSGYEQFDYSGFVREPRVAVPNDGVPYAHGGAGYWLSRRAIHAALSAPSEIWHAHPCRPIEDGTVARALAHHGIMAHADNRYCRLPGDGAPLPNNNKITAHRYSSDSMQDLIKAWR